MSNLNGGSGSDTLRGDGWTPPFNFTTPNSGDVIQGNAGNDFLYGYGGADLLIGGRDNDVLFGADGTDEVYGDDTTPLSSPPVASGDSDTLYGGLGSDRLWGGEGDDVILGTIAARFTNVGGVLYPEAGNDLLGGGAGNDTLYGGGGNDTLDGDRFGDVANPAWVADGVDVAEFASASVRASNTPGTYAVDAASFFDTTTRETRVTVGGSTYVIQLENDATPLDGARIISDEGTDTLISIEQLRLDWTLVPFHHYEFMINRNADGTGSFEFLVDGVRFGSLLNTPEGTDVSVSSNGAGGGVSPSSAPLFAHDDVLPLTAGTYEAIVRTNAKLGTVIELVQDINGISPAVPRFNVQIHKGNYSTNSEACYVITGNKAPGKFGLESILDKIKADIGPVTDEASYSYLGVPTTFLQLPVPITVRVNDNPGETVAPPKITFDASQTITDGAGGTDLVVTLSRPVSKAVDVFVDVVRGTKSLIGNGKIAVDAENDYVASSTGQPIKGYRVRIEEGETTGTLHITSVDPDLNRKSDEVEFLVKDYRVINYKNTGTPGAPVWKELPYREDVTPNVDQRGAGLMLDASEMRKTIHVLDAPPLSTSAPVPLTMTEVGSLEGDWHL